LPFPEHHIDNPGVIHLCADQAFSILFQGGRDPFVIFEDGAFHVELLLDVVNEGSPDDAPVDFDRSARAHGELHDGTFLQPYRGLPGQGLLHVDLVGDTVAELFRMAAGKDSPLFVGNGQDFQAVIFQ